jgi:hypothetical protein
LPQDDFGLGLAGRLQQGIVHEIRQFFKRHDDVGPVGLKPELNFSFRHGGSRDRYQDAFDACQRGKPGFRDDGGEHVAIVALLDALLADEIKKLPLAASSRQVNRRSASVARSDQVKAGGSPLSLTRSPSKISAPQLNCSGRSSWLSFSKKAWAAASRCPMSAMVLSALASL